MRGLPRIYADSMDLAQTLLRCSDVYCEAKNLARPTVSAQILRDSRAFDRVASGGSITIRNFERALQWFSDHWPADVTWPDGIPRPMLSDTVPSEAAE